MKQVAIILSLFFPIIAIADEYRDTARRFSITLPPGWTKASDADLKSINDFAAERIKGRNFQYVAVFSKDPENPLTPPYILIQETNIRLKGANYDTIEKMFGAAETAKATRQISKDLSDLTSDIKAADRWTIDRARNRMSMSVTMTDPAGTKIKYLSIGNFGEESIIQINSYALEDQFANLSPDFDAINDSFRFDRGAEFHPVAPTTKVANRAGAIGQLIGIVLGLVIGIFVYRKFKRAPLHA